MRQNKTRFSHIPIRSFTFSLICNFCYLRKTCIYQLHSTYIVIYLSQLSCKHVLPNLSWYFILRETTPEILGPWEELEFTTMGTILLIVFKFSTFSTTNSFSVFPTDLKDTSGSCPSCTNIDSYWVFYIHETSFSSCIYSCFYPHNFSLSFCYPSWYK